MKYTYVTDNSLLPSIAQGISSATVISTDTETTGFSPLSAKVRLWSINTGKNVYVIDCFRCGNLDVVIRAARDSKAVWVLQNAKFDAKFTLYQWSLELNNVFDTFRASNLIYNGKNLKHDLWTLYRRELGIEPTVEDLGGSDWKSDNLTPAQLDYAADDVIHLPALRLVLRQKLIDLGLVRVAKIEFDAIVPEAAIELAGFRLDPKPWLELADYNAQQEAIYKHILLKELPHPGQASLPGFTPGFNLESPSQMLASLRLLGVPVDSTNETVLAMAQDEYPIIQTILDHREFAQALKTFGPKYLDTHISPVTGRVHTSFYPFTGCGRYSSSKPNLQQLPRKKEFRKCFAAPTGKCLVICDFSQVELRVAAEISGDQKLMGVYQRNEDAHSQTAALVSGCDPKDVTKGQRSAAKAINFGLIYGMGAAKLPVYAKKGYGVNMSLQEAQTYHHRYFEAYRGVKKWHRAATSEKARSSGMTRTIGGRLRYLDPDFYTEFLNTPVQGSGADGLKAALRIVYERLRKYRNTARIVHMVHDEIVVECDVGDAPAIEIELRDGMVEGMQQFLTRVPVIAEVGSGPTWAEK